MMRRAAARLDRELDPEVARAMLAAEPTRGQDLPASSATITRVDREVRLEQRTPVSDQGAIGSCYANAWCDAMELVQPEGRVVQLSRMFAWYNARLAHGDELRDEGTFGAVMSSRQRTLGACPESLWPYDGRPADENARAFVRPPLSAYQSAYDHRAGVSYVLPKTFHDRVRAALRCLDQGHPLVAALAVSDAWDEPKDVLEPPSSRDITGYHAVILDGYLRRSDGLIRFDVRNSWGEHWGRQGHVYVSAGYLARSVCDRLDVVTLCPDFGGPT